MDFEALVKHISTIHSTLQAKSSHAVNIALTDRNSLTGCYIVELEHTVEVRVAYGDRLLNKLHGRVQ